MAPELIGRLIDAHAAALTLYARQRCAAPEDVVQEAFVKLATRAVPPPHVVAWLYTVVRNRLLYEAGGRAARPRPWGWPVAAGLCASLTFGLGVRLATTPEPVRARVVDTQERTTDSPESPPARTVVVAAAGPQQALYPA